MKQKLFLIGLFAVLSIGANAQTHNSNTSSFTEGKTKILKLYPNPSQDGVISVVSPRKEILHFYIFDLEGKLVYQALLKNNEKKKIENLATGTYLYSAFENDQSIEEGKLIIK